jgi:hypothetical protein
MNSQVVMLPPKEPTRELYLIGFRLDPTAEGPQFYTLMGSEGEDERPITCGGRVLFFRKPAAASRALAACDNGFRQVRPVPAELELLCDIGGALHVANQEEEDADGLLFELIAVFDDLLRAVKLAPPPEFVSVLAGVAGQLTESREFAGYLAASGATRERLEDALLWCVGAAMAKSSWVE